MESGINNYIKFQKKLSFENDFPLVVDLDGTLIKTDLLYEGAIILLRKNPLYIFKFLLWLLKGKAYLKNRIFKIAPLQYESLPYNMQLLKFLEGQSSRGRRLILATASLKAHAQEIAKIYPIFDEVFGTENVNLKGRHKLKLLVNQFGALKFDYIGDSRADLKIFPSSRYSYLVNPSRSLENKTEKISHLKHTWNSKKLHVKDYIKAARVYQWIKNVLIFVPLFTSHSLNSLNLLLQAVAAFFAFSFAASAGYIINDLFDLNSDRSHPRKRLRPFASGKLSIATGVILTFILLAVGLLIASQLNPQFLIALIIYFVFSFSYSLYLKKIVLYDVFILALLYSSRVIAGGLVTNIAISFWLIAFSTLLFLSLAFVKRYSELMKIKGEGSLKNRGREYGMQDLNLLQVMGITTGFLSIVVFSLYIESPEVSRLYSYPKVLWGISLLFLFWISRIWVITNRGEMTDDPIVFAVKDASSYLTFVLIGVLVWLAM
ncbi:MAG: UbiA family prenyltransferase [Ferruginibacter sp.]